MKSKESNINLVGIDNFEDLDLNKNNFFLISEISHMMLIIMNLATLIWQKLSCQQ